MRHLDNSEAVRARDLSIRPMRSDELGALADLWVASWQEAMPEIDFAARWAWITAILVDPATTTLVAAIGPAPCGFAVVEGATLQQIAVAPRAKGGGAARALIAAAKALSPEGLALEVNEVNARALRFYEREGFRPTGLGRNARSGLPTRHMRWP